MSTKDHPRPDGPPCNLSNAEGGCLWDLGLRSHHFYTHISGCVIAQICHISNIYGGWRIVQQLVVRKKLVQRFLGFQLLIDIYRNNIIITTGIMLEQHLN